VPVNAVNDDGDVVIWDDFVQKEIVNLLSNVNICNSEPVMEFYTTHTCYYDVLSGIEWTHNFNGLDIKCTNICMHCYFLPPYALLFYNDLKIEFDGKCELNVFLSKYLPV
jgi:hypothetical protein